MKAVTLRAPGDVAVVTRPEPVLGHPLDALIQVRASSVCGSDLHTYRGRIPLEPDFVMGHEYVGTVIEVGDAVSTVAPGDRVVGSFMSACGTCPMCRRADFHKCERVRTFGAGAALGGLQGTQAERALVPFADLTLRRAPDDLSDEVALFVGDVLATAVHYAGAVRPGDVVAVVGLGPVGLATVQTARVAGAAAVIAIDLVEERLEMARRFGAVPVHLTEDDPSRATKAVSDGRGADVVVEAVGHADALRLAIRLAARCGRVAVTGAYSEAVEVPMGLAWIKSLHLDCGQSNPIHHVDRVLSLLRSGALDPTPLVTHHLALDDAAEAYALFDRREALKIMLHVEGGSA